MLFDDKSINKIDKRVLKTAEIQASVGIMKNREKWWFSMNNKVDLYLKNRLSLECASSASSFILLIIVPQGKISLINSTLCPAHHKV